MYNQDPRKAGTARRYLCSILNEHVNCYTVHVSMYGYVQKESDKILPYTEESCILLITAPIDARNPKICLPNHNPNLFPSKSPLVKKKRDSHQHSGCDKSNLITTKLFLTQHQKETSVHRGSSNLIGLIRTLTNYFSGIWNKI